ncbi:nicotinate-nucleotide--dimethylbenzimidazole phosphoribosyltransferase [Lachnospiraceae bacterium 42-17]|jgi:nicotinate-nucleotide--dimethylbenzimidazole phosphoribosyltransferase|nr:nicotinate-nucleotide--dimethylbenzimidazole phosphoribosyltransferase [Dorea sp.]
MTLDEILDNIESLDIDAMEQAQRRWNSIAKPLHGLGRLEEHIIRIAGISKDAKVHIEKKALIVMCADNGVVEEGVTQTGQEVTAVVAENFLTGNTSAAIMSRRAGAEIFPIDIGMARKTKIPDYKVAYGTKNMAKGPAMTREEAVQAIMTGIRLVKEKKEEGFQVIATGEMGIGNTTTSSAVSTLLLGEMPERMTGRGAGLTSEGLEHKVSVIKRAIERNRPVAADTLDVLAKVGGFDIAGLTGVFLGGAYYRLPVVIDGFISAAAALAAYKLCPFTKEYMFAAHVSGEPGMKIILDELGMEAVLSADMCLGEGTGALAYLPVLDMAAEVYDKMSTFSDNNIEDYEELGDR